jgi:hypothetical protein
VVPLCSNVAVIQRGAVSFGDKALLAMEAGAVGVIFINDDADMIAPQLGENSWPPELEEMAVPAICLRKADGDRLCEHAVWERESYGQVQRQIHIRWWDLTAAWAARRIQKQWERAVEHRRVERRRVVRGRAELALAELEGPVDSMVDPALQGGAGGGGEEGEDLEALFNIVDADGDGSISKQETMNYLQSQGITELSEAALDMMWTLVDLDGNGTVDIEEFLRLRWVIRKRLDDPGMKMGDALRLLNEFNATSQTTLQGS